MVESTFCKTSLSCSFRSMKCGYFSWAQGRRLEYMQCLAWGLCRHLFLPSSYPCWILVLTWILWSSVCILSIIRLWSIRTFGFTADPTWDNLPATFWSTLETTAAVTCACMPPIRGGFMRLFPTFWQTSVGRSTMPSQKISMGCIGLLLLILIRDSGMYINLVPSQLLVMEAKRLILLGAAILWLLSWMLSLYPNSTWG